MTYTIGIFDALTGQEIIRQMTEEEQSQREKEIAEAAEREAIQEQAKADKEIKRLAALAKLEALGLDEDDLKALGL